jgi:hypothetical protein
MSTFQGSQVRRSSSIFRHRKPSARSAKESSSQSRSRRLRRCAQCSLWLSAPFPGSTSLSLPVEPNVLEAIAAEDGVDHRRQPLTRMHRIICVLSTTAPWMVRRAPCPWRSIDRVQLRIQWNNHRADQWTEQPLSLVTTRNLVHRKSFDLSTALAVQRTFPCHSLR